MEINKEDLRNIVENIINQLEVERDSQELKTDSSTYDLKQDGIFDDMDTAIDSAESAHDQLMTISVDRRKGMIQNIRKTMMDNLDKLASLAVKETTLGRVEDKILKNRLATLETPGIEDLEPIAYSNDYGMTLVERAPYGVIGSITPSTNPTSSIINNGISMIAGGNTVVFNPHPGAKKSSFLTISLMNQAIIETGGPQNVLCAVANPTIETAKTLMQHPKIKLLVVTGGPQVVKTAMSSNKKVIAAGPGNPPCVVDETVDPVKVATDIVNGAGFDNNIVCICEKEILVVSQIADTLKKEMGRNHAYELKGNQIDQITQLVITNPGKSGHAGTPNKKYVGKNANIIAKEIGLDLPDEIKILFFEAEKDHPLVWTEQLMPVIPLVRFSNVDEAIDFAVKCEHSFRHTASMHSKNIDKLSRMAKLMNCSLFVKNGPCYSGMGYHGAGFTSYTIATPTGEGMTRARNFTRERRCVLVGSFRIV